MADEGLQESLNNVLERTHGSIRERAKVMRGIKIEDTPILPMNQIYYNFIRPHQGLKAEHPQRQQELGFREKNKWEELLKRSASKIGHGEIYL